MKPITSLDMIHDLIRMCSQYYSVRDQMENMYKLVQYKFNIPITFICSNINAVNTQVIIGMKCLNYLTYFQKF